MSTRLISVGRRPQGFDLLAAIGIGVALAWAYWPPLTDMATRWAEDSRYSHGYLVVGFAVALLVMRRDELAAITPRPSWGGVMLIVVGCGVRLLSNYIYFDWLERISLLPCLAGLIVLGWGWEALRVAWPAIAFLAFMVPLPFSIEQAMGGPLQSLATVVSTFALQTIGFTAQSEGNVIIMEHATIGVVEACSGLSMMILFFALSTGVAMLIRRPLLDRLIVVASAVPIALIANITRITVTGVLHETVGEHLANVVFHDLAGWLMTPLALLLLGLVLRLLSTIFVEAPVASVPGSTSYPVAAGETVVGSR